MVASRIPGQDPNAALWWQTHGEPSMRQWHRGPYDPALQYQDWSTHPWVGVGQPGYAAWAQWAAGQAGTQPTAPSLPTVPVQPATPGVPAGNATARARAAQLLYGAMRGMPFLAPEFLGSLQAGEVPRPGAVTPQALGYLAGDTFLSDNFFALIRAASLYPTSYLAEVARFQPKGMAAAPSFI